MAYTPLRTDFKDDILDPSNYKRKYKQVVNNDGTFSFQDETTYQQVGSDYGAKEINEEREAINNIYANKLVTLDEIDLVTEEGFFVDALAVKELNSNLTSHINNEIISYESNTQGGVTWDTTKFLKKNTKYHFIIVVNSNINSESYKQEVICTMNGVNMGSNGNYYKLMSVFSGICSADNKDKIVISSYKNGGTWTGWYTRAIFIPVS
ncbi:hypothetical protein [Coprococcus comes]|uniref:hypothetical protein n=1 Tax=Coprococcus comes TaxID=410072 RepID=UPI00189AD0AE|nr:hypothetical protein [Coprococcus comes]